MVHKLIRFIRDIYCTSETIPLHVPLFCGNEKSYVAETIDSTFVSSVGKFVDRFEEEMQCWTGAERAVATVNGTAALHSALYMAGVQAQDLIITQALTFVATCNAIWHMGAEPIFVDVSRTSLGLDPLALASWLEQHAVLDVEGVCRDKKTQRIVRAVVPMHTFGHPVELDEIACVCDKWHLALVEDAAESLGSYYKNRHTGTIGRFSAVSFNGNKIITTGGGGMVLCQDKKEGIRTKHITTTAKVAHQWAFFHDEPGFNFRMPNINAALGCAQMEKLPAILTAKRQLAQQYAEFFAGTACQFVQEPEYARSNYWLNAVICPNSRARETLLRETNAQGVMTRPVWTLMHRLPMYRHCYRDELRNSQWAEEHLVNLPSTPVNIV